MGLRAGREQEESPRVVPVSSPMECVATAWPFFVAGLSSQVGRVEKRELVVGFSWAVKEGRRNSGLPRWRHWKR
jgi:hypothetical protein